MIQKIKKITCALGVAFSVGLCQMFLGATPAFAQTQNVQYKTVSITNSSFASNPTSSYLDTSPSGWTAEKGNAKKGIINVDNTKSSFDHNCTSSYNLKTTENPGQATTEDNKVLMVNARSSGVNDTSNSTVDGFTSDSISLSANSYYRLSVWVNTINNAHASIVLTGFENTDNIVENTASFYHSDIQTAKNSNEWVEYSYYISTSTQSQTVKLKLMLGAITETNQAESFGAVFFDEVSLIECSEAYYYSLLEDENASLDNFNKITYISHNITDPSLNFNFENGLVGWEEFGTYQDSIFEAGVEYVNRLAEGDDFSLNNTKALRILAEKGEEVFVGFRSKAFDIDMANAYKISVMAKATDIVGTINIKLVETDYLEKTYGLTTSPTTSTITFTSTETNQLTNDYTEYVFYVYGYELYDTQAQLELTFGEESVPASGSVVFDSIKIERYTYEDFSNVTDNNQKHKKVTLSTISGTPSFTNGTFNKAHHSGVLPEYPLIPDNWTQTSQDEGSCVFGVVNTTKWNDIALTKRPSTASPLNPTFETVDGITIPTEQDVSNNILMMYNKNASKQVVTSPTFTADKNSYYALTFNYYNYGDALTLKVMDADKNIVFEDKLAGTTAWDIYKIYFKTEYFSVETLSLALELDNQTTGKTAYAYFDNFQFFTPSNFDNTAFQTALDNGKNTIDLSNLGIHQTGKLNPQTSVYDATMFTGNLANGTQVSGGTPIAFGGIITENNIYGIEFPDTHTSSVTNMLMLKTLGVADYTLTSKNKISLTTGEYYKFSVFIKTSFASSPADDQTFGAYFKLVGIDDAKLTQITNNLGFFEYNIYLTVDKDTDVAVQFGLNSDSLANQTALFDTFTFEKIEASAFNNVSSSNNLIVVNHETQAEAEEDDDTAQAGLGNVWIEISTILMIVAIIVAIVGAMLRKTKFKKFKVQKEAEYASRASLVRDVSVIEAEKRRNAEIAELVKEKDELNAELKELEAENKARLAEQRKLTGKTITRKAEKEFRAYASRRQKLVKEMGRIDDRIQEAQSTAYLNRIIKIVQMEKIQEIDEAENKNPENV